MPEICEVERLRTQLAGGWIGRKIERFRAPPSSPNPKKYAQDGWSTFLVAVKGARILGVNRIGKHLWVQFADRAWQIHLGGTGWFTVAKKTQDNFIHSVSDKTVRVKVILDDGSSWDYHDSRTWGKWWIKEYQSILEDPYFQTYGPDWLLESGRAGGRLVATRSRRRAKDVLCDQKLTAGIGNYLACEILHRAGIHPHSRFDRIGNEHRLSLVAVVDSFIQECMKREDHGHWKVFLRKGEKCLTCQEGVVGYAKDIGGSRGSYFCPRCQPKV